jgi:hypothetical protein
MGKRRSCLKGKIILEEKLTKKLNMSGPNNAGSDCRLAKKYRHVKGCDSGRWKR